MVIRSLLILMMLMVATPALAFDWRCFLFWRQAHREQVVTERPAVPPRALEEVQTRPARDTLPIVHEYLTSETAPKSVGLEKWYENSVKLPAEQIDPYFFKLAEKLGGEVVFGGGSDLVEMTLGLPKLASPGETNIVMKFSELSDPGNLFQTLDGISAPAWKGRKAMEDARVSYNGESGADLSYYVSSAAKGEYLVSQQPMIVVPLKHAAIVQIKNGEARMFFRTPTDMENYRARVLTLPEQHKYPKDFLDNESNRLFMPRNLEYAIYVYSRGITQGWSMHPTSVEILRSWVKEIPAAERKKISERVMENLPRQLVDGEVGRDVLTELGMPLPAQDG